MKKRLWMGVTLAMLICACASALVFADESAKTNCIGDASGKTNCMTNPQEAEEDVVDGSIVIEKDLIDFGRIVEAGRRYSQKITIRNETKEKATIRVEAIAYDTGSSLDERQKEVVDWLAFGGGKRRFEVAAGAELQVSLRLMVPADVKGGSYYAKVKISDDKSENDKFITVKADIALEGFSYGGKIVSQNINFVNMGEKAATSARLKNEGTGGFTAHYEVRYKNAFGLPEWKQMAQEYREMLPGSDEAFEAKDDNIGYGIFTVEQKIIYINSEGRQIEAILSHAVVNVPWWGIVIAAGAIVLIVVVIVAVRVHKKKDMQNKAVAKAKNRKKKVASKEEDEEDDFWDE